MSKKVNSDCPIPKNYHPTPTPAINSTIKKVATPILDQRPTTTPPLPPLNSAATSIKETSQRESFCFKVSLNDNLRSKKPLNISEIQGYMQKGDQAQANIKLALAHYFQAICTIDTSQPNLRGLLLKAICYLKSAKLQLAAETDNCEDLRHAQLILEAVLEKILDPANKEADHCRFISLLGSACLTLYIHTEQEAFLNQARISFRKAAKLLDKETPKTLSSLKHENQDPLRHKIAFGLALSHFYHAKNIFCSQGTAKTGQLLHNLQDSRLFLEQALSIQEGADMSYMLALIHALTGSVKDLEKEKEKKEEAAWDTIAYLNQESLEHLNTAVKILKATKQSPGGLILLGIVSYKLAFGRSNDAGRLTIDFDAGIQALNYLSDETAPEDSSSVLLCLGDCARQITWLSQLPFYKSKATKYLEEASSTDDMFAETLFLVFSIQNDLFKLIEVSSKMQGIDKEAMTSLCDNLFLLKSMFKKKSEDGLFKLVKKLLTEQVDLLEQVHYHLAISSETPDEAKEYARDALKIGDNLNKMYVPILFEYALTERLRAFDLGLELEQDF